MCFVHLLASFVQAKSELCLQPFPAGVSLIKSCSTARVCISARFALLYSQEANKKLPPQAGKTAATAPAIAPAATQAGAVPAASFQFPAVPGGSFGSKGALLSDSPNEFTATNMSKFMDRMGCSMMLWAACSTYCMFQRFRA